MMLSANTWRLVSSLEGRHGIELNHIASSGVRVGVLNEKLAVAEDLVGVIFMQGQTRMC